MASRARVPEVKDGSGPHYKLFVVSNCAERYLEIFHRHTPMGELIIDRECFGRTRKLKHENVRLIIDRQKLFSFCYIGDTAGDEDAAMKDRVPFFHARYGFEKPAGNPVAIDSFGELVRYFESFPPSHTGLRLGAAMVHYQGHLRAPCLERGARALSKRLKPKISAPLSIAVRILPSTSVVEWPAG